MEDELTRALVLLKRDIEDLKTVDISAFVPLTDFSTTSTITGWSSFTIKSIFFSRENERASVQFHLAGTSNSAAATFTLPYNQRSDLLMGLMIFRIDNSTNGVGYAELPVSSNLITCYSSVAGAGWTTSGTKDVRGEFWYQTT